MPKSRKRPRSKRRRTKPGDDSLALDRMFDRVAEAPHSGAPPVLYHYTTLQGAQGIIASQRFWATAHDCTNDEAELVSADAVIIEVAKKLQNNATGAVAGVLRRFVEGYAGLQVTKMLTVCLACFSVARDHEAQWKKYGDDGRGVCLGIRIMNEAGPVEPEVSGPRAYPLRAIIVLGLSRPENNQKSGDKVCKQWDCLHESLPARYAHELALLPKRMARRL